MLNPAQLHVWFEEKSLQCRRGRRRPTGGSDTPALAICLMVSPVRGSITSSLPPCLGSTHSLLMNSCTAQPSAAAAPCIAACQTPKHPCRPRKQLCCHAASGRGRLMLPDPTCPFTDSSALKASASVSLVLQQHSTAPAAMQQAGAYVWHALAGLRRHQGPSTEAGKPHTSPLLGLLGPGRLLRAWPRTCWVCDSVGDRSAGWVETR